VWHHAPQSECSLIWIERPKHPQQAWFLAKAGFGYADEDDATLLEMQGKQRAVWIRHDFDMKDAFKVESLDLEALYDDGFVAFLNGHEVVRANVSGDISKADLKNVKAKGHEAKKFEKFSIKDPKQWLQDGQNVLAIVGVNTEIDSTDFSLHPLLSCKVGGPSF